MDKIMKMRMMVSAMVCAAALAGFGAVGERPGVLTGTPEAPLLVSAIGKTGGRVYLLGTDGRIVWEQTDCGNIVTDAVSPSTICTSLAMRPSGV